MLEFEIGITHEELRGVFKSALPNDIAFAKALELLVAGWRDGEASLHLEAIRALLGGERLIEMRRLEPSLN